MIDTRKITGARECLVKLLITLDQSELDRTAKLERVQNRLLELPGEILIQEKNYADTRMCLRNVEMELKSTQAKLRVSGLAGKNKEDRDAEIFLKTRRADTDLSNCEFNCALALAALEAKRNELRALEAYSRTLAR